MAWLAYLLLPITGLPAFLKGKDARVRFHGLQSIVYGLIWPAALFAAAYISSTATQIVFIAGALVWLALLVLTLTGRDPKLPLVGEFLSRASTAPPS